MRQAVDALPNRAVLLNWRCLPVWKQTKDLRQINTIPLTVIHITKGPQRML